MNYFVQALLSVLTARELFSGEWAIAFAWLALLGAWRTGWSRLQRTDAVMALWRAPGVATFLWLMLLLICLVIRGGAWSHGVWCLAALSWCALGGALLPKPGLTTKIAVVSKLSLLVWTLFLCLWTSEVGLRMLYGTRPPDDQPSVTWGVPVHANAYGFRCKSFELEAAPRKFRILAVGDSFTWGTGLPEEERWTDLLEARLKHDHPELQIEILNLGMPGAGTFHEWRNLLLYGTQLKPDLVILGYCYNDPESCPPLNKDGVASEQWMSQRVAKRVSNTFARDLRGSINSIGLSVTYDLLKSRMADRFAPALNASDWRVRTSAAYDESGAQWQSFLHYLSRFAQTASGLTGRSPLLVPLPSGSGDFNKPDITLGLLIEWNRRGAEAGRQAGFEVVDMTADFVNEGPRNRWVNQWDAHPDAICHQIYASAIGRHLENSGALKKLTREAERR